MFCLCLSVCLSHAAFFFLSVLHTHIYLFCFLRSPRRHIYMYMSEWVTALFTEKARFPETSQKVPISNLIWVGMTSLFSTVPFWVVMIIDSSNIVYDRHESISSNHIHICWIYHDGEHRWMTVLQHGAASAWVWFYWRCRHRIVLELLRSLCRWRSAGNVVTLFPPSGNLETTVLRRWLRLASSAEVDETSWQ